MENSLMGSGNWMFVLSSRIKLSLLSRVIEQVECLLIKCKDVSSTSASISTEIMSKEAYIASVDSIETTINSVLESAFENFEDEELKRCVKNSEDSINLAVKQLKSLKQLFNLDTSQELLKENINVSAKTLLEECIAMFMKLDEIEMKHLVKSHLAVTSILSDIKKTCDKKELVIFLKELTKNLTTFLLLISKLNSDSISMVTQYQIALSAYYLRRTIHIFHEAVPSWTKHPKSMHGDSNKDCIVKQMNLILESMLKAHKAIDSPSSDEEDYEQFGDFAIHIDQILQLLTSSECITLADDLVPLIKQIVCHSLAVAHLSLPIIQTRIHQSCQQVLHLMKMHEKSSVATNEACKMSDDVSIAKQHLKEEIENLKKIVNSAVLRLVTEVVTISIEPLFNLIAAALQLQGTSPDATSSNLKFWIDAFHYYTDRMYQITKFAILCSTDTQWVCTMNLAGRILEMLDPEVVPAILAYTRDSQNDDALHHLHLIKMEWCFYVEALQDSLLKISDVPAFFSIVEVQMKKGVSTASDHMYDQEGKGLTACKGILLQGISALKMANVVIKKYAVHTSDQDIIAVLQQLKTVIEAVKTAYHHASIDITNLQSHRSLMKRIKILVSSVHKVGLVCRNIYRSYSESSQNLSISSTQENRTSLSKMFSASFKNDPLHMHNLNKPDQITTQAISESSHCSKTQSFLNSFKVKNSKPVHGNVEIDLTAILEDLNSVNLGFSCYEETSHSISSKNISALIDDVSLSRTQMSTPEKLKDFFLDVGNSCLEEEAALKTTACSEMTTVTSKKELVSIIIKDSWNSSRIVEVPEKLSLLMSQLQDPEDKESQKNIYNIIKIKKTLQG